VIRDLAFVVTVWLTDAVMNVAALVAGWLS
jgi:hypothetical protein